MYTTASSPASPSDQYTPLAQDVADGRRLVRELTDSELLGVIDVFEAAYRRGEPLIADARFDFEVLDELKRRDPEHPRLETLGVEAPETFGTRRVRHSRPMLSIAKANSDAELQRWVARMSKVAESIGLAPREVQVEATPKLDGYAGNDDPVTGVLATRGNGLQGSDITHVFDRGVIPVGGRGQGLGELVLEEAYFRRYMTDEYEHPRNVMVGIGSADKVSEAGRRALAAGAARFVPYSTLPRWQGTLATLAELTLDTLFEHLERWDVPYRTDGLVLAADNEDLREAAGATSHHYRWMLALKRQGERAETTVRELFFITGRTGVITPAPLLEPVRVSGAVITTPTAHNAGWAEKMGVGAGARVVIVRSGEVIPKIAEVLEPRPVILPTACPSCGAHLVREGDFLHCPNTMACPAQVVRSLAHFFHTLGNVDLFGERTVGKLVAAGVDTLEKIYGCDAGAFERLGFGSGQSVNLERELRRSITQPVDDFRFLAAFGLPHLGTGMSRRLLQHHRLEALSSLTEETLTEIPGFGKVTAPLVREALADNWPTIEHMLALGFRLNRTPLASERTAVASPIAGKRLVFTGTLRSADRKTIEEQATALGATVQAAVSTTTDFLVCGEKVGAAKTAKARTLGTAILSEEEYLNMLKDTL